MTPLSFVWPVHWRVCTVLVSFSCQQIWEEVLLKHLKPVRLPPSAAQVVCGLKNAIRGTANRQVSPSFQFLLNSLHLLHARIV